MCTTTGAVFLSLLAFLPCQTQDVPPPPEPIKVLADSPNNVAPPDVEIRPAPPPANLAADVPFGTVLKGNLLQNLPGEIVIQQENNWGHQAHIPSIQGLHRIEVLRNHGNWERMKVICRDVPHRLRLIIDHVSFPEPGRMTFVVHVDVPADLEFDKQIWQNGLQIFGGQCRGRVWFKTVFAMEATSLTQDSGFRIVDAGARSYRFVAEKVNGAGGDLAKMFGGSFQQVFLQYQKGLEETILARVREAMLQADESPEVAASWARLVKTIAQANLAQTPPLVTVVSQLSPEPISVGAPALMPAQCEVSVTMDFLLNGRRAIPVVGRTAGIAVLHEAGTAVLHTTLHTGASILVGILSGLGHSGHGETSEHEHRK